MSNGSGVTWVGDIFLVVSSAVSSLVSFSLFFSKPRDLFLLIAVTITIAFYCFQGVTPSRVSHHTFFYLSDLVSPLFFVHLPTKNVFPSGVTPLEDVTRGGPPPPL